MNVYLIGNTVTLTNVIEDAATGDEHDPVTLTLFIENPRGEVQEVAIANLIRVSKGSYYYQVIPGIVGLWKYRWESNLPFVSAAEGAFRVRKTSLDL